MECPGYPSVEANENRSEERSVELHLIKDLLSINRQLKAFAFRACDEELMEQSKLFLLQDIGHAAKYLQRAAIRLASNAEIESN
jgi:hypothetical protein